MRFERVALAHNWIDAQLAKTALDSIGIVAITEYDHLIHIRPYLATAYGGIPILVPVNRLEEAGNYLKAAQNGSALDPSCETSETTSERPTKRSPSWIGNLFRFVAYFSVGAAPALPGLELIVKEK